MRTRVIGAVQGRSPFSLVIRNVRIVNVYNDTVTEGSIGIVDDRIAYAGPMDFACQAEEELDGGGCYALPGFVDAHMHLESSMLTPAHFAEVVLACGTTTVAADPHEIGNVLGLEGVRALMEAAGGLPLRVLMMAPSTIPSAPGFEDSGYDVGPEEAARLLLSDPEPLKLQTVTTDEKPDLDLFDPDLLRELLQLRGQLFSLLQDRSLSLFERLTRLLGLGSLAQWQLNNFELPFSLASDFPLPCAGNAKPDAQPLRELLGFLAGLEPIDPQWPAYLQDLSRRLEELLAHRQDFLSACAPQLYVYEKLCAYTLYRYLHKAVWDGDLFSRVKFAVCFALLALLQDLDTFSRTGALPLRDQILHTKAISKELDYSEENLDAFCDESWKSPSLSCDSFRSMISLLLG